MSGCDASEWTPSKRSASARRNSGSGAGLSGRDDVYSMSGRGVLYVTPMALSAALSMIPSAPKGVLTDGVLADGTRSGDQVIRENPASQEG